MRTEQMISIGLDVMAFVGLIALQARVAKPLFWMAVLAGIGIFAIRLSSDASWWTGHLIYTLRP